MNLLVGKILTAPVAIVGGGPVGLMLALFLDRHAVKSVVFNTEESHDGIQRAAHTMPAPWSIIGA